MIARMAEDEVDPSVASRCRTGGPRPRRPAADRSRCQRGDRPPQRRGLPVRRRRGPGFARRTGEGPDVVLLHGVPVSSFLYRKVLPVLADQGLRATAFDFPGLGLAERPEDFDYTWSRLAVWTGEAIDALGLDRVHLVVHDIGGPIGFEWAIRNPDRVLSMTVLNTLVDVGSFRRPGRCTRSRSAASARSGCARVPASCSRRSSTGSGSRTGRRCHAPTSTRTSRSSACVTVGGRSSRSCGASS